MKFDLENVIAILERTPIIVSILLRDLAEEYIHCNEGGDTWSPYDIVGHYIHGEKTDWIPRAGIILEFGKSKPFESFDRFAQFKNSKGRTLDELLDEFTSLRNKNIQILRGLDIDGTKLKAQGMHPELGQVTLEALLSSWVAHDLNHINQITRVLAKNYKSNVGPWIDYISVLK